MSGESDNARLIERLEVAAQRLALIDYQVPREDGNLLREAADALAKADTALRFYADPDNWGPGGWIEGGAFDSGYPGDRGQTARAALDEAGDAE